MSHATFTDFTCGRLPRHPAGQNTPHPRSLAHQNPWTCGDASTQGFRHLIGHASHLDAVEQPRLNRPGG